jgi:nucleotide-binding universal stress UspA family protein
MIPKKILFCTDFSENSRPAQELAIDYAKAFGANLLIVNVIDSSAFSIYMDWVGEELGEILERMQKSADKRLEELVEECGPFAVKVKTFCKVGLPAREIVSLANKLSVDLIVMGTHGLTGVKHLVMGSIARSVLKTAHRPVLIVEARAGEGESSERPYLFPVP